MERGLSRNQLKYLVIIAMVIDHIGWAFVPTASYLGQAMHFIGRLTGPTMAFFVAEGYLHTRDVKTYALRLGLFALLSWPAFSYFEYGRFFTPHFGVIYTLLLGLLAVWIWDALPVHPLLRLLPIAGLCWLSQWGDWSYWDVLWPLALVMFRDKPRVKWWAFTAICAAACGYIMWYYMDHGRPWWYGIHNLGILLAPLLLRFGYSGESGSRHPFHKWFFYAFYPAHLVVLALLQRWL